MVDHSILITESDLKLLRGLLVTRKSSNSRDLHHLLALEEELERAEIVDWEDIPPQVVTMYSRARVRDLDSKAKEEYTVVFPRDVDPSTGRISVLAPLGTALLGAREGDRVEFTTPGGRRRLAVDQVLYQPESRVGKTGDPFLE